MAFTSRQLIIDEALGRIGSTPEQIDDQDAANPLTLTYETTVNDLLGRHPWTWMRQTTKLFQDVAAKPPHWDYAHKIPSDISGPPLKVLSQVDPERILKHYELGDEHFFSNEEELWLVYRRPGPVRLWPGPFQELVILALGAKYCIQVREDVTMSDRFDRKAFGTPQENRRGGQFQVAASTDGIAEPGAALDIENGPLVDARF